MMKEKDISRENITELLEDIVPRDDERFSRFEGVLNRMEEELSSREEILCHLKDRELESLAAQLRSSHRKEQFINEIGQQLTSTLDIEAIISTLHRSVKSQIPVDRILLAFYSHQDDTLVYRVFEEDARSTDIPETIYLSSIHRIVVQCVQEGKLLVYNSLPPDEQEFFNRRGGAALLTPLKLEGCVRGVLLLHSDETECYTGEHEELLRSLTPFLAIAVSNSRNHEELDILNRELTGEKRELISAYARITKMANYDSLTDLPNLRLLNEFIPRYMDQAKRQGWMLALLFIDLDDFKPVNDNFGHEAGDRLLIEVSRRIRESLRNSDVVARVGGDEFIALVQGASGEEVVSNVVEKILLAMNKPFLLEQAECRVGVSIGISLYPQDGITPDELKKRADRAMYYVKGRNKAGFAFFSQIS